MTPSLYSGFGTGKTFMAHETLQREKPAGSEPDGPFDYVHGEQPGNGVINDLDHIARLDPSATGDLVNSTSKEIYDG